MSTVVVRTHRPARPTRRERRAERRRLERLDALAARLAELRGVTELLDRAAAVVGRGWVQGAWFVVDTPRGERTVTAYDLRLVADHPVTGACLVGAIVQGGGGPAAARTQLVQQTLDLTWRTLHEEPVRAARWCAAPRARVLRVLELTHWNDDPRRRPQEVIGLLRGTQRAAECERELCLAVRRELAGAASR